LSTFLCFLYFILRNFPLVLKVKCAKFHQNRSKTVDLHTKQTFKQRSNLARFYGTLATLATTRKAMEGRTKPSYVVYYKRLRPVHGATQSLLLIQLAVYLKLNKYLFHTVRHTLAYYHLKI
jgi:hypothetical protein